MFSPEGLVRAHLGTATLTPRTIYCWARCLSFRYRAVPLENQPRGAIPRNNTGHRAHRERLRKLHADDQRDNVPGVWSPEQNRNTTQAAPAGARSRCYRCIRGRNIPGAKRWWDFKMKLYCAELTGAP
jgi:hypothetical protein